ncbi:MAG: hypothetical protein P4M01_13695 [Acidobacteriota bacterium]|nr:hypothetical protein [Acidobacteriota bacterium]
MRRWDRAAILLGVLLVCVTLLVYSPVRHYSFLTLDDDAYVPQNQYVNTGLTLDHVGYVFTHSIEANYTPLAWISYMLDCQIFGLHPAALHLENIVLHAANAALVFWLLLLATGARWRSFLVAAFFALEPMNVETAAWIAERKSLLSALFCLLAMAAYGWYAKRPGRKRYLLVALASLAAMLAKPMAVTLPLLFLLLDQWPLQRWESASREQRRSLVLEKVPLLLLSLLIAAAAYWAQGKGGGLSVGTPLPVKLETALVACAAYLKSFVLPVHLSPYYPHPEQLLPGWQVALSLLVLLLCSLAVYHLRARRYIVVGWLWYLVALLPASGLVKFGHILRADRFTYLPFLGLFVIVVWGCVELAEKHPAARKPFMAAAVCVLVAMAALLSAYLPCWRNGVTVMSRARAEAPPDFAIEELLGEALTNAGDEAQAMPHYQQSCRMNPHFDDCHINLAVAYYNRGDAEAAIEEYKFTLGYTTSPRTALLCLVNSAKIAIKQGNYAMASSLLSGAMQIDPANTEARALAESIGR